ncbi:hypothetical protein [Bradyrhizobium brasilense]|uniref:hypothetical protein n=1 Tax=Bradyrhizobium brasilense TaxID=1419277 RepID=UPI001E4E8F11|nr:hypothetical protein [Bradyrhizobium brasilense]
MTDSAIGPDNLTMAIALGGRPEDNAKIVWSRGCIAYFFQQIGKGNAASISHAFPRNVAAQHRLVSLQTAAQQFCCGCRQLAHKATI